MATGKLRVVPLGGLGEIGKNMMALEYGQDIIVIDAGLMFPEEEMPGIDLVIPDITYLLERREKVRGIVVTHGHEDHTGALPYILPRLNVPVYSTRLTHGLISVKLKDHHILKEAQLQEVEAGDKVSLGQFNVEFLHVNHSIPDAAALAIHTPKGMVVHSGDFKLDHTPVDGRPAPFARLAQLGAQGVLLLLSDSTYVERPGYTPSERIVGQTLDRILGDAPGRVIVATFASLISRVQQVIDAAAHHQRKVVVMGHSMVENVEMARSLGYLSAPPGILARIDELASLPPRQVVVVTAGSQGEPTSSLARMANREHSQIRIVPGDTVVLSATPVPGNETLVSRTIDSLFRQGAQVLYETIADVHVHGHGSQEELKMMISLVKPRFFIPIHGEYRHLILHQKLAQSLGLSPEHTFVLEDGDILELDHRGGAVAGKVPTGHVYVDGLGVGDVGPAVLRDRRHLSRDGVVIVILTVDEAHELLVSRPEVVSRGFVEAKDAEALMARSQEVVMKALGQEGGRLPDERVVVQRVRDALGRFLYEQTKRRPMILPVTVTVGV